MATKSPANSTGTSRCVAVDLGPRFVRVVEVEQAGTETKITRRGSAALPPNCWNEVGVNRDAIAASVREALTGAGITTRRVVACLPRRLVTVRFARLPQAPPEQIRGMIEFEAQQYILFPLNEVILDYHVPPVLGTGLPVAAQEEMQIVLLAAARRSLVADVVSVFDRLNIELAQLSVSALALAEHVRDALEPTAVIALEPGAMDVCVVADGQLLFTRSSALDIVGIAREVAARRFSEEVARSFTAYQNEFRQRPLAHLYLCGSETATADGEWMDRALVEALEKPVGKLHSRLLPSSDPEARSYAIAAGMALEALGGALSDINLVPNERAEKKAAAQRARRRNLLGFAIGAAVIAGAFYLRTALDAQEKRQKLTADANKAMNAAQLAEKPIQHSHDRVMAFDRILNKSLDRDHPSVDVLVALNRCLPRTPDIWLTQLSFDRGSLMTIRGDSKNSRSVTDLLINLQASGAFTDVRLSYLADAQDTATTTDTVQAAPRAPVTPLPGLQPAVPGTAAPMPGGAVVPGAAAPPGAGPAPAGMAPGGAPGAVPNAAYPPGFAPNGGGAQGAGGFGGERRNFGGGNQFNQGGYRGGGFGNGATGAYNPGTGQLQGAPRNVIISPNGPQGTVTVTMPAQAQSVPGAAQAAPPNFQQGAPTAAFQQQGGAPSNFQQGPGSVVITPEMAAGRGPGGVPGAAGPGAGGQGNDPAMWRRFRGGRNGVTDGGPPSSVNMTGSPMAGQSAAATQPPRPAPTRKAAAPRAAKPTITGFVITCRLIPNAKLVPPTVADTVRSLPQTNRPKQAAHVASNESDATDNSADTGDIE